MNDLPTTPAERSWPEDMTHENGNYVCHCAHCQHDFIGHKRRVCCRVCHREAVMASASTASTKR